MVDCAYVCAGVRRLRGDILAAPRSSCSLARAVDGRIMCCIISLCMTINCHFRGCKELLVTSLTYVKCRTLPLHITTCAIRQKWLNICSWTGGLSGHTGRHCYWRSCRQLVRIADKPGTVKKRTSTLRLLLLHVGDRSRQAFNPAAYTLYTWNVGHGMNGKHSPQWGTVYRYC